jgi:2'-5' RNA ligase
MFVALRLPKSVREALAATQAKLRALLSPGSATWPKADHLHLTLCFLGDVSRADVPALRVALGKAVQGSGEVELACETLGCFPGHRFPRVVWAGVRDYASQLSALHHRVNEASRPFVAQPPEGRFVGHITLARLKRLSHTDTQRLADATTAAAGCRFGEWKAAELELIRSELKPGGSRYSTVATFGLNKG